MAAISEKYIMGALRKYLSSKPGQDLLKEEFGEKVARGFAFSGGATEDDISKILLSIRERFIAAVIKLIPSFREDSVHAEVRGHSKNGVVASVWVEEDALKRESLHYMKKGNTIGHGEGVRDILALFTHGYTISGRRPFGFWVRDNAHVDTTGEALTRVGARMHRDPNPCLSDLVEGLNAEYEGVCKITLNERYIG